MCASDDSRCLWTGCVPVTGPVVAQRVGRCIDLLFPDRGTRRGWVVSVTPRPLFTPGKDPVPIVQETGWAPGPIWTAVNLAPPGFDPRTFQAVVSRYTDWATGPTENRVLRRIFWPNRNEVTGGWIKLHNEELNDTFCSPNIVRVTKSRRMRCLGHVARWGERRGGVYRMLVGKPEGKRPTQA